MIHQCTLIKKSPLGIQRNCQWYSNNHSFVFHFKCHSFVSHSMKYIDAIPLLAEQGIALLCHRYINISSSCWWRKTPSMIPSLSLFFCHSLPLSPLLCNKRIGCVLSGTIPFLQTGCSTNKIQCPWPVIPPVHTFTRTHAHTRCISMQQASQLWLCQSSVTHKYRHTSW